ncbi:MAG: hypothetical protein COV45_00140 [Deltaproteobacteria bacterium CG11_big_fil_rev_8_21_14_0_20_47_16]|nr:MAG: hypothetical protein COV45_00140 [Deltaproteobacteria bacterium CG11_big_fil_rev_8_21_14_0_20_47_16]
MILAAMGGAMAVLVATNQETRNQQLYKDQSFASAQGGIEVVLGLIANGVNPCDPLSSNLLGDSFLGNSISVTRINNKIYVVGSKGGASTALSVTDPVPPSMGTLLTVDTSNAHDASNGAPPKKLIGITFQLQPGCGGPVTITSMIVTWSPNYDELIQQIKFDGGNVYSETGSGGAPSGDTIDIVDTTIADASVHTIDFIRWNSDIQNRLYTIQFNFGDGSNKIFTIDTQ